MRSHSQLSRLTACLVATGLISTWPAARAQPAYTPSRPLPPQAPAMAASPAPLTTPPQPGPPQPGPPQPGLPQPGPPQSQPAAAPPLAGPAPGAAQDQRAEIDPPARVGRVARLQGTVSFHAGDAQQWTPATLNYPVTAGSAFWTQPDAQGEVEISDSRLDLSAETELDLATVDEKSLGATMAQGELFLDLQRLAPGETWTVQTPRGTILMSADGRYGIAAGDTAHPTVVTVLAGAAIVTGAGVALQVGPGQAGVIDGTDTFAGTLQPAQPDAFLQAMVARLGQTKPLPPGVTLPPLVARMPGCTQLASYGTWKPASQYGTVWYPQVASGWVPYRDGHWAYVAPWGWTWVDAAPWGFAPFHYGRWAQIEGAWAWVPGSYQEAQPEPQPVYAPALVTFVGPEGPPLGEAFGGFAAGALLGGAIAWLPLGPREPYYPWFHARPGWVGQVNAGHVGDVSGVVNNYTRGTFGTPGGFGSQGPGGFVNRGAGTLVPAAAMVGSRPVGGIGQPLPATALDRFHPVFGREPLRPVAATAGVTPSVAARLGVPAGPPRLAAPGPALLPPSPAAARAGGPAAGVGGSAASGVGGPVGPPGARPDPAARPAALPLHIAGGAPGATAPEHRGPPVSGGFGGPGPAGVPGRGQEHPLAGRPGAAPGVAPIPATATPAGALPGLRPGVPVGPTSPAVSPGARPGAAPGAPPGAQPSEPLPGTQAGRPPGTPPGRSVVTPSGAPKIEHAQPAVPPPTAAQPSARFVRPPTATVPHGVPEVQAIRPPPVAHVAPAAPRFVAPAQQRAPTAPMAAAVPRAAPPPPPHVAAPPPPRVAAPPPPRMAAAPAPQRAAAPPPPRPAPPPARPAAPRDPHHPG